MYQNHVPTIAAAIRHDPRVFRDAVMFAVVSARTQFITVPGQMLELELRGRKAKCLWSWKSAAYDFMHANAQELHREIMPLMCPELALRRMCQVPGLGIVKAAFVLQMAGFDLACIDARNIIRDGRKPREYRTDGVKSGAAFERKVARYVADTGGKAEHYWDAWCIDVAEVYKKTPHEISEMHLCFIPQKLRKLTPAVVPMKLEIPF